MTREERQSLIHEGSGTVMSAYVEIVFDNTDRRFPIDKDEVVIRRTIGMKKDDHSLDSKLATKADIMNLLESAGFSKSNPYYIVPQGRITSLTNAQDSERLQLLKEVAGARVFETKLKDSLKEMTNTNKKKEQIDEMLRYIEGRLEDLDLEKNDLKHFEKLNNRKKALEYNLYDRELTSLNDQIESLESDYASAVHDTSSLVEKLAEREKQVQQIESSLAELTANLKLVDVDISENDSEIRDVLEAIGDHSAQLKDAELEHVPSGADLAAQIAELNSQISQKEVELGRSQPALKEAINRERSIKAKLDEMKQQQRSLLSKKGRFSQFESQEQRDAWLHDEIKTLADSLDTKKSELSEILSARSQAEASASQLALQLDSEGSLDSLTVEMDALDAQLGNLRLNYSKLIDERKQLWREESKLNSVIQTYEEEKARAQQGVSETMDRSMALGLESVQRIAKDLGLNGVYGTLGELINVSEKYKTAAEVVGGSSLFHVVVDTDRTATLIMDELVRQKAGRVTFMPLNRLHPKDATYPETSDSVPLMKKIAFDEYLEPAVKQIFGKTVVCISLEKGAEIASTYKLNAITLDGDRCDRKGVLTGGFRDQGRSRIDCLKSLTKWKTEIYSTQEKLATIKREISEKDSQVTQASEELAAVRKELDAKFTLKESHLSSRMKLVSEKSRCDQELNSLSSRIETLQASVKLVEQQIKEYNSELKSDFREHNLSDAEVRQLESLSTDIVDTEKEYNVVNEKLSELELRASSLTSELNGSLYPRLRQLNMKSTNSQESSDLKVQDLKRKLESLNEAKNKLETSNSELMAKSKSLTKEMQSKEDQLQKLNESQRNILRKLENYGKSSEKSLSKKILLSNRRDEISRKIRDLGVLSEEAFTSFKEMVSGEILILLNEATEGLKQYSHVNKKALEQFVNFTKQRDSLVERRDELDQAKESIEELISVLERRKDDAIIRTFKEVSLGFTEVFEKLVPAGTGKLIIQKRSEKTGKGQKAVEVESDDEQDSELIDQYVGVSISVSFNSRDDEQQRIEQLSGGQKSLCAIALILAIQKCDPAPFYLFDEIDANLDAQYRSSVSQLIHELSQNAQFICTTFRPEMLKVCDKFFGVMFNNKVSTVSEINQADALGFVEGQQRS
ncbi:hypothetical protein OGAPHI_004295 [Ogataea philodendri]|uniref:SMC hinge domain-containing protein n=2 Tax=Saccharomycotina TaxID=147537 RepID=A0A9P8T4U5_9ASCO|nr:uncharacterized protein OGAPHI_004295 [Ogataea philodendri]KAH3666106.1 hypothetical protein OGAPHI_004295 [Ogataea philodendri]